MKKSCLVALGALVACIGAANAASMKEICLANPSQFVWVEKNQDCVPISPCSQPEGSQYYKLYCNDMWSDGEYSADSPDDLVSYAQAKAQADWYIKHVLKDSGGCIGLLQLDIQPAYPDKRYIKCMTGKGDYMEFKIGSDSYSGDISVLRCEAMGKVFNGDIDHGGTCVGVTKEQCEILAEGMGIFEQYTSCPQIWFWNDPYVNWEGEMKEGRCNFTGCV